LKLFLVVDLQKDRAENVLSADDADRLDEKIAKRIRSCRYDGTDVAFTVDTRFGRELLGRSAKQKLMCDMVFYKNEDVSHDLAEYLRQKEYSVVEISGLVFDGAVSANAEMISKILPRAEIIIDKELTN